MISLRTLYLRHFRNGTTIIRLKSGGTDDKCPPPPCPKLPVCKPPEPQIIALEDPEADRKALLQRCTVLIREPTDYSLISGTPLEVTCKRIARIYQPPKNAQQQGTRNLGHWQIDFETQQRWENPLMGWCSSGDPLSNVQLRFATKEEAIEYCQNNKLRYWVQVSKTRRKFKPANYGLNFHFNRRTRVSTK